MDPNLFQKAVLQQQKGFKKTSSGRRYIDGLPPDGNFDIHLHEASLDPEGTITSTDEERIFQADCGDYLASPESFGGRCKLGYFVCRHHFENCPRNHPVGSFDWESRPRIRPCTKSCWLVINLRRLASWLLSSPDGEKEKW
ncbi:MAG: hypothetical protein KC940_23705 [Candidatus Omnitrophica bacterium]|nr:hypothetical protein [Candidatus Omnitrophota bacterium]